MIIKSIGMVVAIVIIIVLIQALLLQSFHSNLPAGIEQRTTEVGWCMLFTCEKISYPTAANVTEPSLEIGFDFGPEDLKFGQIPKGGGGKRFVNIKNDDENQAKVKLVSFGNISSYIQFNNNDFILDSGESIEVRVDFKTETEMESGRYSGGVTLVRISPKHELLNFLIRWF